MTPINYQIINPQEAIMGGLQIGAGINEIEQQRAKQEQLRAQQEAAQRAAMQQQEALSDLAMNPNAGHSDYARVMTQYPGLAENLGKSFKVYDEGRKQTELNFGTRVYSALLANKPELVVDMLDERAKADPEKANDYRMLANMVKEAPGVAKTMAAMNVAALQGVDKFATGFATLQGEQRAADAAPAELRRKEADADKAIADASTAASTATIKGEEAKVAAQTVKLDLEKKAADLGLTKAQTNQAFALTRKYDAETKQAALEASTGNPEKRFEFETKLRNEYTKQVGTAVDTREAYRRIKASKDDAVGDLSLIFGYMKMLDPGSVVREGEFATAQNAAGIPERVMNAYNRALKGERLTPGQRKAFLAQAEDLNGVAEKRMVEVRKSLEPVVNAYKLDPRNVYGESPKKDDSTGAGAGGAPPKVSTDADYNALPAGALFVAPDGTTRKKP